MKKLAVLICFLLLFGFLLNACVSDLVVASGQKVGGSIVTKNVDIPNRDEGYVLVMKNISFSNSEAVSITCAYHGENSAFCSYPNDFDKFGFSIEVKEDEIVVSTEKNRTYKIEEFCLTLGAKLREVKISGGVPLEIDAENMPLERITVDGATQSYIQHIKTDNFVVKLAGAGRIELDGKANEVNLDFDGAGEVDAKNLCAQQVNASLSGVGTITVSCKELLNVTLDGAGALRYYGSPKITSNIIGVGNVEQISPVLP